MIVAVLLFLLCVVQNVNAEDVPAGSELPRLVDDADILTDSEEKELNQQLDTVSEEQECDVIIVTVDSLNGKTVEEYADDYYDDNGYGYGENDSGILFLVAMDDREWNISTSGDAITAFTDAGLAYMEDQFVPDLSDGAYLDAFSKYTSLCDDFLTQAEKGEPYDTGHLPKKKVSLWWIAGDLLIGAMIAFVMAMIKKTKLKSVKSQVTAAEYEKAGSLDLTVRTDHFVNRVVTTRKIERKQESGGSSVHTGSSGKSHGGRSGKF
ncbi:TPM domain-containing protein [Dorea longicatena]|nr:TPM domain-containing protein [Dorea longicatena]